MAVDISFDKYLDLVPDTVHESIPGCAARDVHSEYHSSCSVYGLWQARRHRV